jgi:hypothetical protein
VSCSCGSREREGVEGLSTEHGTGLAGRLLTALPTGLGAWDTSLLLRSLSEGLRSVILSWLPTSSPGSCSWDESLH